MDNTTITSFKYELGLAARDSISGYEGIILSRVHHLFGCAQYGIVPKETGSDGQILKTEYFDEGRIEITGDGVKPEDIQENEYDKIFVHSAGKAAKDKVTGFQGKIVYRMEYMHGANQYALAPGVGDDGKLRELESFDEGRIEIIGDGINPEDVQAPKRGGINRDAPNLNRMR